MADEEAENAKAEHFDNSAPVVTTLQVCGESLVASRHTIFWTPALGDANGFDSKKFVTRGSITRGAYISYDQALISTFREVSVRFLVEGDRIVFVCEVRSTTPGHQCFLFIVTSTRGGKESFKREESMVLLAMKKVTDDDDANGGSDIQLIAGIPIMSSMTIEFRGRGVFGIHVGERCSEETGLYFETKSLHSMWTAIVSLEKVRDQAKNDNLFDSNMTEWMLDYFPLGNGAVQKARSITRNNSSGDSEDDLVDPEEEGEGGSSLIVAGNSNPLPRTTPSNSFSSFVSNVRILESELGIAHRMFSLTALRKTLNRKATLSRIIGRHSYEKPDIEKVYTSLFDFVSSAQDPDNLSMGEVIDHLKDEFGEDVIGKLGYSSAKIDSLVYKVVGQMEPPSKICDKLYLGSEYNAANKQELRSLNVSHVLNVTVEVDKFFPEDFKYHQVCVLDKSSVNIIPYFERAVDFIEEGVSGKGTGCLVHCQRGVSRSASFVIAYLMKKEKMTAEDAIKFVKERRRIVKPNSGFVAQLKEWEKHIMEG